MGKYIGVIAGAVAVIAGVIWLFKWWHYFASILKGSIPALIILAGAIAVVAGVSEIRDEAAAKREAER